MGSTQGQRAVRNFLLTFGVAVAIFAIARWVGFDELSWTEGLIGAVVIATVSAVWDAVAERKRGASA
jgi:hypothetical protein